MAAPSWYALPVDAVVERLATNSVRGLSSAEVQKRHAKKLNQLPETAPDTLIKRIGRQIHNPIVLVLVFATVVAVFVGTHADAIVIAVALLFNVVIGVYQEQRAAHTFAALRRKAAVQATVIRDNEPHEIDAANIVPGDIVLLSAGTAVPADIRLIETHELAANEVALTGEWVPITKTAEPVAGDAVLAERTSMIYAGALITAGSGRGITVAIGTETELGKIAVALATTKESETPLARDMRHIAQFLLLLAAVAVALVFGLSIARGVPFDEAAIIAIAVAVASIPEGLPAAVTVVLALGMERILAAGGLVKELLSAETLGATSVILTDKTGTLTEGRMRVVGLATHRGVFENAIHNEEAAAVLRAALLASDGYLEEADALQENGEPLVAHGRPIEQAIIFAGIEAGISKSVLSTEYPRIDELPFDSARRFGGMLVSEKGESVAYLSGAPELFIEHTRDAHLFKEILSTAARESERMIAIARTPWHTETLPTDSATTDLLTHAQLIGFVIFADTPRPEVAAAVKDIRAAGARVVMATGDNPETAIVVARAVGIANSNERPRTGADLQKLSDDDLYQLIMAHSVFARVTPDDKLRMVRVLRDHKEVVAMTGDGINDAPALRSAAIGIAIGSGTDVAKEAADIVLLKDSFAVITAAIREGRRLRDNVKKIFVYLVATNFGETFLIVAALIAGLPLPILPTQILWENLVTGGPMNVAFAFEPLYESAMNRKPKDPENAQVLSRAVVKLIALAGFLTSLLLIGLYWLLIQAQIPEGQLRTMMFVALSFSSMFTAFSLKSLGTPFTRIPLASNKFLLAALGVSVLMLLSAFFVPGIQYLVYTVSLSVAEIVLLLCVGLADLVLVEFAKYLFYIRPALRRANNV
ncbi:MAG: hypothetical protein B7X04_00840 [Parcubacteria group bacterium 21-54-25]|nr:MAG: hypothetical protein B7X04_00840 [Parcubacteria group bacterium 21-54-25]HQU07944.1 HAD-IC family P-type ATPase [Candidatus Paceibacterota bacterium]